MATLLLRLAAPLQAWGTDSKFDKVRQTGHEPSKSGVIGLLAAALGRGREESVEDLTVLRFGVRVLREGRLLYDYHTVSRNPSPRPAENKTDYDTKRYYLSDAAFLAGVEGDEAFLSRLASALDAPAYPLFLGRRSCPPTPPLSLGVTPLPLEEALLQAEVPELSAPSAGTVRLVMDAAEDDPSVVLIRDRPISYSQKKRVHGFRRVSERLVGESPTVHDAFGDLEVGICI